LPTAHVAFYLPQVVAGGAESNFARIASALYRQGYSVDILVSRLALPLSPHLGKGVGVVELRPLFGFFRFFSLLSYLWRKRPAVLMCGLEGPILLGCLAKALGMTNVPVVASVRNRDDLVIRDYPGFFKRWVFKLLYSRLIGKADRVIAISRKLRDDYLVPDAGVHPEKIDVILNPIELKKVRDAAELPIDEEWSRELTGGFLLAVGRLELQKDYPTLFKAYALIREKTDTKLLVLGEGAERTRLEALSKEMGLEKDILMPGYSPNPFRFMKRANVFVLSSKHEGFGNVLLEAMACGVPIVSADCPSGPSEILGDGKWGKLVPVGDPHTLAKAVLECLASGDRIDYGPRLADFDFDRTVDLYRTALGLSASFDPPREGTAMGTGFGLGN
jgi:glycosyltransferase involved in cell wall biosynthesis